MSAPTPPSRRGAPGEPLPPEDDTLTMLFLCCHPALSAAVAAGVDTAGRGRAHHRRDRPGLPGARGDDGPAHQPGQAADQGDRATFGPPPDAERTDRLRVVLQVLYLLFNEGYTATSGSNLVRADLTSEAIRLTRAVRRRVPDDGEVAGLLALMLLTEARRPARTGPDGALVPLAEQDRALWDADAIAEGVSLITGSLATTPLGPYQVQAAIAAVHDEAARAEDTDWPQILALYGLLDRVAPSPMVTLNRAVAVAMVHGPRAGLDLVDTLTTDGRVNTSHRIASVRAHLLEMAGDHRAARVGYRNAARRTTSLPERRHLLARAARLR